MLVIFDGKLTYPHMVCTRQQNMQITVITETREHCTAFSFAVVALTVALAVRKATEW